MKRTHMAQLGLVAAIALGVAIVAADFDLSWHTIDGGGGTSSGGAYTVSGTIGQHDAGAMSGGTFTVTGGFWAGAVASDTPKPPVSCPGDLTGPKGEPDGEVSGFDLLTLLGCWGIHEAGHDCLAFDFTGPKAEPDGEVSGFDLLFLLGNWGPCPDR